MLYKLSSDIDIGAAYRPYGCAKALVAYWLNRCAYRNIGDLY